jgi:hypothetical protein
MTGLILPRRAILRGLVGLIAAPAIVRADSLMKLPLPPKILRPTVRVISIDDPLGFKRTGGETFNGHPVIRADGSVVQAGEMTYGKSYDLAFNSDSWVLT